MTQSTDDFADQLAKLTFGVVRYSTKLTVLTVDASVCWAGELLIRSFKNYWPHKSLLVWLVLSVVAISCAVLDVAFTHSLRGWVTLVGLIVLSLLSLSILDRVLAGLANQGPQQQELEHGHAWNREDKQ